MLKSQKDLQKLPPESQDIFKRNILDRYVERPAVLEELCLADFVSQYTFKGKQSSPSEENNDMDHNLLGGDEEEDIDENISSIKFSDGVMRRRRNPKVIRFCNFNVARDENNFYRERLMLFKPWRNESEELEKVDVQQVYLQFYDQIKINSRKYIKHEIDLDSIAREIENARENQTEGPEEEAQNEEIADELTSYSNVYDFPNNTMEANVMFDIGEEASVSTAPAIEFNKIVVPDLYSNEDYINLMGSLNQKQYDYIIHVVNEVKLNATPFYHFIGGEAGVGKSKLITALYQTLTRHYRLDPGPVEAPNILICAYTGKAAHGVGGVTAHNAFLLSIKNFMEVSEYRLTAEKLNNLRVKFAKLKIIIIDEVSLFGRRTFEKLNERLKEIFKTDKLFGGLTIIVLGHFGQLRPVKDDYIFASSGNSLQRMVGNILWEPFVYFELTEIMRQKDDLVFAEALGRLSIGTMTNSDVELFKTRCFSESSLPSEGKSAMRLMWRNLDVAEYNTRRMSEKFNDQLIKIEYRAEDTVIGATSKQEKQKILHNLENLAASNSQGLSKVLILQYDIRYMVTSNIDVSDGLFNGAVGVLKFIEFINGKVQTLFLEFDDLLIGRSARALKESFYRVNPNVEKNWTPINRQKATFKVTKKGNGQV